jgi:NAD(P)-dependent dehydrogenase (short-subunit alcohol dehydrogenase family)
MTRAQPVVLITHADSDVGYRRARDLVADGYRVVVTAEHTCRLTRILLGQNADQVMAIAADIADPIQRAQLMARAEARFGPVTWIVDGRTGSITTKGFASSARHCGERLHLAGRR